MLMPFVSRTDMFDAADSMRSGEAMFVVARGGGGGFLEVEAAIVVMAQQLREARAIQLCIHQDNTLHLKINNYARRSQSQEIFGDRIT
jgi:hypothetical protein